MNYIKTLPGAIEPTRAHPTDSGFDLYYPNGIDGVRLFPFDEPTMIDIGIAIQMPNGYDGTIKPRSSLNKCGVLLLNSPIDNSYRGSLKVLLMYLCPQNSAKHEHPGDSFLIKPGDRIAQLVIRPVAYPHLTLVDKLSETKRGVGGFGSTGR